MVNPASDIKNERLKSRLVKGARSRPNKRLFYLIHEYILIMEVGSWVMYLMRSGTDTNRKL